MKITRNPDPQLIVQAYRSRLGPAEKNGPEKKTENQNKPATSDRVEISNQGREMQKYMARLKELPEAMTDVVENIRKQLLEGTYQVDEKAIAKGIVNEHRLDKLV